MRRRTKCLFALAAAAGLGPWLPGWLAAAGLDVWNAPELHRQVEANLVEGERLTAVIADAQDHIRTKDRLAEELAAGRITLADAVNQFEAMVAASPLMVEGLRVQYPDAATDRERVARHVIDYTRVRVPYADQRGHLPAPAPDVAAHVPPGRPMS